MKRPIAQIRLLGRRGPNEEAFPIDVEIGEPYKVVGRPDEWACSARLAPLYNNLCDAHSNDSLQSLCLAISLVLDLLSGFRENGGELLFETGEPFPLEAYCFGAALGAGRML